MGQITNDTTYPMLATVEAADEILILEDGATLKKVTAANLAAYTGGGGVTIEQVQDDLGNTSLIAGTSMTKVYNDAGNTITLNVTAADFATAAQGAKADTATQPGDLGSAASATLIDDDTFASATASNIPSAESVKAYVDASGGGGVNVMTSLGMEVKCVYRTIAVSGVGADGWYLGNSTTTQPTFTARTCSIIWEGTAAQIPAQGTGDSALQAGDHAIVRTATF